MFTAELIDKAASQGIRLTITPILGRLKIECGRRPDDDLLELIEQHERAIIRVLLARSTWRPGRSEPFAGEEVSR